MARIGLFVCLLADFACRHCLLHRGKGRAHFARVSHSPQLLRGGWQPSVHALLGGCVRPSGAPGEPNGRGVRAATKVSEDRCSPASPSPVSERGAGEEGCVAKRPRACGRESCSKEPRWRARHTREALVDKRSAAAKRLKRRLEVPDECGGGS